MALTPEDGTGLPNADCYVSVLTATSLLQDVGVTVDWSSLAPVYSLTSPPNPLPFNPQEGFIRRAASLIDQQFAFRGRILTWNYGVGTQSRAFPRIGLRDQEGRRLTGVPQIILEANAELAFFLSTQDIIDDPAAAAAQGINIGPINIKTSIEGRTKKLIPDYLIQKLTTLGSYRLSRIGFRKIGH